MSKQTAVEWYAEQVEQHLLAFGNAQPNVLSKLKKQAKEMEKEQHEDTWLDSRLEDKGDNYIGKEKSFEEYFTENYGNNK
jgi:hypothetical protein